MAGDWIKMRTELQSHPKVVRILSATRADKFRVIGGLHAVWGVFDAHSSDGILAGYTPELMDHIIGWDGFSAAMLAVGWLEFDGQLLVLPEFDEHNSQSAKRRAEDQKRKRNVRNLSGDSADKLRTKSGPDKREDSKPPTSPIGDVVPQGGEICLKSRKKSPKITFKDWLDDIRSSGQKAISEYAPVFDYAEKVGIPVEWIELAWLKFRQRYSTDPNSMRKRYADWRHTFMNAVKDNWMGIWATDREGRFFLTTVGQQAQLEHRDVA